MSENSGREGGRTRQRNLRELDSDLMGVQEEGQRHSPPEMIDGQWIIKGVLASRLWNKSAIGKQVGENLKLAPEEILFCHWNRHVPLPNKKWLAESLRDDPDILHRSAALTTLREPGDILVLRPDKELHQMTWGLRWNRGEHPRNTEATAEVGWVENGHPLNWEELLTWVSKVAADGRRAEILVVDGEFDVTAYRLMTSNLRGESLQPSKLTDDGWSLLENAWKSRVTSGEGYWLPLQSQENPLPQIGVPQASGIWLNSTECDWFTSRVNGEELTTPETKLLEALLERGLWPRPGFKYGCRWRVYSSKVGRQHAPWLIVPLDEAPIDWNGACLAARLAAGVNKTWICAIERNNVFEFLELQRWSPGKS